MLKKRYRDGDGYSLVETDDPHVLRDGEKMRVPMMLADGVDRAPNDRSIIFDAYQPGPVRPRDVSLFDAKERAYAERAHDDENAWRTPPPNATGTLPYAAQVGDVCTCREGPDDGAPGRLQVINGRRVCVPDRGRSDALPAIDARAEAYRAYDAEATNAWRGPRSSGRW